MVLRLRLRPLPTNPDLHVKTLNVGLLQAMAAYLRLKGWNASWSSGEELGGEDRVVVDTTDLDGMIAHVRELPFVEVVEIHGFDVDIMLREHQTAPSDTDQAQLDSYIARNRRFSIPMPPESIVQAVAFARAGFTVTGFAVLEEAMVVLVRGTPSRDQLIRLRDEYSILQERLAGSTTIDTDIYTDIPDGESITFPNGIPLAALQAALDCAMVSFAVYGFAVIGPTVEPIATYTINVDTLGEIIDAMS